MLIDLTDTKKMPTIKPNISISLDCVKSPSSSKKLIEIQKQLGIRMQAKRAAMLADNNPQISRDDEDIDEQSENDKEESDDDDDDDDDESMEISEEKASNIEEEEEDEEVDELSTDEEILEDEEEEENLERPTDPDRPSLKTILTRLESSSEPAQIQPPEPIGQTEWFDSARPAQFDSELEMLCSGAFGGDNIVPLSQNIHRQEPVVFSPLPPTQIEDDDIEVSRPKVRQLVDDDDEEEKDSNEQVNSGSNENEEEEEEEQDDDENEELIDYKKQLFEMEAEESGSDDEENPKKKADDDDDDSDEDDDEPDEELQKFIDTAAVEMDEDEVDNLAKVHLKIKAKEDEHQLKLLKEQYLDFDGDDDGRRIKLSKNRDEDEDEDDPDYNSENDEDEDDDEDEDENQQTNFANRLSELERQRSIQDTQAEELHLDEDLDNIGQHSSMFQKGLALKQKRIQSTSTTTTHIEITTSSNAKKPSRSVTLSSSLLAKRFSSTLLAPINRINQVSSVSNNNNSNEPTIATKKQHNPRRHVFTTNENQNPAQTSGEKRANSADKSPKTNSKRFKQSTTIITKSKETTTSVFSALAFSNPKP